MGGTANGGGADFAKLRYVGFGGKVWEIGGLEEGVSRNGGSDEGYEDDGPESQIRQKVVYRRKIRRIEEKDVQHVEIWKMDSMDIV